MAREPNAFNTRRMSNIFSGAGNSQQQQDPLLAAIRKKGLFQQPAVQPMNTSAITQPEAEQESPFLRALSRFQGGGQSTAAYKQHLGSMPNYQDYAPSKTRRFGAALAAAAGGFNNVGQGLAIGEQIRDAPYKSALGEWQLKGAGLKEQADIERDDVKSQIEYIKRIQEQQQKEREFGLSERNTAANELRAQTDVARQQAQEDNYKRQGWTFWDNADGMRVGDNSITGERKVFGPSIAGREQANRERATNISAGHLGVAQGNLGVAQGNLGMRGQEFGYRQQQDAINNALNERRVANAEYGTDISAQNAGAAGFVNAGENFTANAMAAQEVARTNPRFAGWALDESGMPVKTGTLWNSSVDTNSQDAKDYLAAVETAKQRIISTRRPGVGQVPGRRVAPPSLGGMGGGPLKFGDLNPGGGGGLKF